MFIRFCAYRMNITPFHKPMNSCATDSVLWIIESRKESVITPNSSATFLSGIFIVANTTILIVRQNEKDAKQIENVEILDLNNTPKIYPLKFKNLQANSDGLYLYADFEKILNQAIAEYDLLIEK